MNKILPSMKIAFRALRVNKLRSALTLNVTATGLRTALWLCDLCDELPHLADGSPRPIAGVVNCLFSGCSFARHRRDRMSYLSALICEISHK